MLAYRADTPACSGTESGPNRGSENNGAMPVPIWWRVANHDKIDHFTRDTSRAGAR